MIVLIGIGTLAYIIWYSIYIKINVNARYPSIDSLCTIISLLALFMQAKHWIENWLVWIFVDLIYVPLYALSDQIVTGGLYVVLIILAIKGYLDWKKQIQTTVS